MTSDCSTDSSRDYYGTGVRIGIYCVWLASYLANNFLPSEIASGLDTNTIFMLSLLTSIFHGTFTKTLVDVDALVLMHLSGGFLFGVLSIWGYRTLHHVREGRRAIRHFGRFGTHCRLILSMAISAYGLWFWFDGVKPGSSLIEGVTLPGHQDCPPLTTFFFAKLRVSGGIRIFYLFICIGCSIYFGGMVLAAIYVSSVRLARRYGLVKMADGMKKMTTKRETGLTRRELHQVYVIQRIYNLIWLVYSAIMVECTVSFNQIFHVRAQAGEIASPSQLLPMLIGAFSFIRTCYLIYIDRRNPDKGAEAEEQQQQQEEEEDEGEEYDDDHSYREEQQAGGAFYAFQPPPNSQPAVPLGTLDAHEKHDLATITATASSSSTPTPDPPKPQPRRPAGRRVVQRPTYQRYIIAWLPWLSQTDWWTEPAKRQRRAWDAEHADTTGVASGSQGHSGAAVEEREKAHIVGPEEDVRELKGRERVVTSKF